MIEPTLAAATAWISAEIDATWEAVWDRGLPELTALHDRIGEPAYGRYNRDLFAPVTAALAASGLACRPGMPGSMRYSEEEWGPEHHRERRMWTLLHDERDGAPLGALVTRFRHDHTRLRLPAPPTVVGIALTDHDRIRATVLGWAGDAVSPA